MTEQTFGSKAQVWHGTAKKTSGGLTKSDLMKNKHGRIVSRRKHSMGKKSIKHLRKMGYIAKKGKFTLFHKGHKSRKMRGGADMANGAMANGAMANGSMANGAMANGAMANSTAGSMAKKGGRRSRRMRGGMAYGGPLSPQAYNGEGVGTSGVALQMIAGNAA